MNWDVTLIKITLKLSDWAYYSDYDGDGGNNFAKAEI